MKLCARHNTGTLGDIYTTNIVTAIAEAEQTPSTELRPPLYDVIDPEVIEQLLKEGDETTRVTFQYNRLTVEVSGDGVVNVTKSPIDT